MTASRALSERVRFPDRREAGVALAAALRELKLPPPVIVQGLDAYRDTWPPFFKWQREGGSPWDFESHPQNHHLPLLPNSSSTNWKRSTC